MVKRNAFYRDAVIKQQVKACVCPIERKEGDCRPDTSLSSVLSRHERCSLPRRKALAAHAQSYIIHCLFYWTTRGFPRHSLRLTLKKRIDTKKRLARQAWTGSLSCSRCWTSLFFYASCLLDMQSI